MLGRVLMVILGILLLAPGLCFVTFGFTFGTGSLTGGQYSGGFEMLVFALALLGIGGLICWGAVMIIYNFGKRR